MLDLIAIILLVIVIRFAFNRFVKHVKSAPDPQDRCPCGQKLANRSTTRCLKCGRLIGFNATAEELGLSQEELKRVQAAQAKRDNHRSDT